MDFSPTNSEIFKRLMFRYYPLMLLLGVFSYFPMKLVVLPEAGLISIFLCSQVLAVSSWAIIVAIRRLLNPAGLTKFLTAVAGGAFCGIIVQYVIVALFLKSGPWPLGDSVLAHQIAIILLMSAIFSGGTFILAERSIAAEKKYGREKTGRLQSDKDLIENRLSLLQAQIEPQFLFNTMETISGLFDTAPEKAKDMQMQFIQYLRSTLAIIRERYSTIEQEMDLIRSYLNIYKINMSDRLEYTVAMDPATGGISFPSMLIQPVVENAIRNSIEKASDGGRISIAVDKNEDWIRIKISDTGEGSKEEDKVNRTIADVNERLKSLFGDKAHFRLDNNDPSGLSVSIEVLCE